jgi:hypothetical protein
MYSRALTASDVLELYNWQAEGFFSSDFNGKTSRVQNDSANVLEDSNEVTICAWVYPEGQGETSGGAGGAVIALDEATAIYPFFMQPVGKI